MQFSIEIYVYELLMEGYILYLNSGRRNKTVTEFSELLYFTIMFKIAYIFLHSKLSHFSNVLFIGIHYVFLKICYSLQCIAYFRNAQHISNYYTFLQHTIYQHPWYTLGTLFISIYYTFQEQISHYTVQEHSSHFTLVCRSSENTF